VPDDREARPALRAVGERVAETAIPWILYFAAAVPADGKVRQDVDPGAGFGATGFDAEIPIRLGLHACDLERCNRGQRRRSLFDLVEETAGVPPLRQDDNALA
jgi:hypothetical protein